jgi:hypothetical protein
MTLYQLTSDGVGQSVATTVVSDNEIRTDLLSATHFSAGSEHRPTTALRTAPRVNYGAQCHKQLRFVKLQFHVLYLALILEYLINTLSHSLLLLLRTLCFSLSS